MRSEGSDPATARDIVSVGQLNRTVAGLLERSFPLLWISGEISNLTRAASGHWYFSLKDAQASVRSVMFRGVQTQPSVERWGNATLRGWRASYEFAFRVNWVGSPYNVAIGWDVIQP
jgi:hypothetical protein